MKLGVALPSFEEDAPAVLAVAKRAEELGIDGVFSFDHLFPMGQPSRPALSVYPLLGAVAAVTSRIRAGSLVARVGLLPDEVVLASLESLHLILGERLIAGVGTGDRASAPEHLVYGLPFLGVTPRQQSLAGLVRSLRREGIECWVGAGTGRLTEGLSLTVELAEEVGATVNYWQVAPETLLTAVAQLAVPVSWGGPLPKTAYEAAAVLQSVAKAGATWAVWGWPSSLELVCEAAVLAGLRD